MIEKCIISGVKLKSGKNNFEYEIDELAQLVEASGGEVIGTITQERDTYSASLYFGKGKAEEIKMLGEELDATLLIVNDELTGSQINNLEKAINFRVIDRTMLILDIFALRAQTRESKLQVELAQLKYSFPRIRGKGKEMSKLGGGIGTRGPGESKLETDRRHIENKINEIEKQLEKTVLVRDVNRKSRLKNNIPIIAVVGYTNAGKSTLINYLLSQYGVEKDKTLYAYNKLFATLTTENRKLVLPGKFEVIITDTVGFVTKLPTRLIESFKSTLEEINFSDIIVHLIDITNENIEIQKSTTEKILDDIKSPDIPVIDVYNKVDQNISDFNLSDSLNISAKTGYNVDVLVEEILLKLFGELKTYILNIEYGNYEKIYILENKTTIINREYLDKYIKFEFETRSNIYARYFED